MSLIARLRQIAMVSGVETFGVAMGGVSGLLIVNVLPKEQYAIYTFVLACVTLMAGISELGLSHCVLPVVGQRASDQHWVVGVCHQIFRRRWMLMSAGVVIVLPYWFYTSQEHHWHSAPHWVSGLLMLGVVLLTLRESFLHVVLLIMRHIPSLNRIAFASHTVRFSLVGAVLLLPLAAWSVPALFAATVLALAVSVQLLKRAFARHGIEDWRLNADECRVVDREALRVALPLVPSAIFFHVQGVITVLIVSIFGTTDMMAEVGAFGRLALVLTVFDRVTNMLLFPALARSPAGARFVSRLTRIHGAYLVMMFMVLATAVAWPHYWMLLLGRQYASMEPYLWMVVVSSILMSAAGFAFRTLAVRGATQRQWVTIPLVILVQIVFVALVGVDNLKLVLAFNLVTSCTHFAYQYGMLIASLPGWRKEPADVATEASQPKAD
ncbi:hypothetical protein QTI66_23430 [Variovorax sp. J22R133]|uniref:hypothetical protein n=1 Tax=Variovorax brevis TaxID=3053503 RepID=UPI0025790CDF|nr:hypothetical protein [Variovorax sp. J22R133]MDM0115121.1 hypothetical protein [Variovorax sp. J22R133]